jgi:hypothetical protein
MAKKKTGKKAKNKKKTHNNKWTHRKPHTNNSNGNSNGTNIINYTETNDNSSEQVKKCMEYIKQTYPNSEIIDISDRLKSYNYRIFKTLHMNKRTIMIAEKNYNTKTIFIERGVPHADIIIMYKNEYLIFETSSFEGAKKAITRMISGDFNMNECKICFNNVRSIQSPCCETCGQICCYDCISKFNAEMGNSKLMIGCPFCKQKDKGITFSTI